ncbi:TIR domain-containing protein [Blastococcus sp. SYSU DS0619]
MVGVVAASASRGADQWQFESEDEFFAYFSAGVDSADLALESEFGTLRLSVDGAGSTTTLVVALPTIAAVELAFASLGPSATPAEPPSPVVFIGHGRNPQWRELADHLRDHHGVQVLTYESAVRAGIPNHSVLQELAERATLALLVHTVEEVNEAGDGRAGDNVIHETGLFQALLGAHRAIVIREDGCRSFANVHGVNELRFAPGRIVEVFGEVLAVLRREHAVP